MGLMILVSKVVALVFGIEIHKRQSATTTRQRLEKFSRIAFGGTASFRVVVTKHTQPRMIPIRH